jgi:hypothetical protein
VSDSGDSGLEVGLRRLFFYSLVGIFASMTLGLYWDLIREGPLAFSRQCDPASARNSILDGRPDETKVP